MVNLLPKSIPAGKTIILFVYSACYTGYMDSWDKPILRDIKLPGKQLNFFLT